MKKLFSILALAPAICLTSGCFNSVSTGEAGMKVSFGKILSEKPLQEGIYFYLPWQSLVAYNCQNRRLDVKTETFTKDVQYSKINLAVTFALDKSKVISLHRDTGFAYVDVVLVPNATGALKDVIGSWEADAIMASRAKIASAIEKLLSEKVSKYGILVKGVEIVNIDFSDEFEKAVENKQIALQRAIQAKNKTQEIEEESRQKVIAAEADAKALEIKAKALETSRDVLLIDVVKKWDGKLPAWLSLGGVQTQPVLDVLKTAK